MGRMPSLSTGTPVADKDLAETFTESDLTLSHNSTEVNSESVELGTEPGDTATITSSPSSSGDNVTESGVRITPSVEITGLSIDVVSDFQTEATDGYKIERVSDGTIVEEDTTAIASGGSFSVSATLAAGTEYAVYLYDSAGDMDYGADGDVDNPSTDFDVNGGWLDSGEDAFGNYNSLASITADQVPATSGTAYVEWSYPPDVYAWDVGVFQATLDGETVQVYVEEAQGSPGWTEIAGPIQRGDSLPADPSNNVRYRVEFSRSDVANNPHLDAIYRRRKL
jgi:hypothetical protein